MKKRGASKRNSKCKVNKKLLTLIAIAAVFSLSIFFLLTTKTITGHATKEAENWFGIVGRESFANFLRYIIGEPLFYKGINAVSAGIVTIAIWLLIFLTFSDIIATFSSFSKWISWSVGFLIAVIAANIGLITKIATVLTGIFAFAGVFAVYVGLGAALFAFVAVNLGLWRARKWILKRRAMMSAAKAEAGGKRLGGIIRGLKEAGEGLEELGK